MLKQLITKYKAKRAFARLKKAVAIVEAAGYTVSLIKYIGNTAYILSENGEYRKIGKRT